MMEIEKSNKQNQQIKSYWIDKKRDEEIIKNEIVNNDNKK